MRYFTKHTELHLEDRNNLLYWSRRWSVEVSQINDAVVETGSIRIPVIREALIRKAHSGNAWFWLERFFRGMLFHRRPASFQGFSQPGEA